MIGISEIVMAIWIVSGYKSRLNAITQMILVALVNTIEVFAAPQLLLWGKLNMIFAMVFIGVVYYNEFILRKKRYFT